MVRTLYISSIEDAVEGVLYKRSKTTVCKVAHFNPEVCGRNIVVSLKIDGRPFPRFQIEYIQPYHG